MDYFPQIATVAGVMLLACISPGPDLLAVTSHALSNRRSGLGVAAGISSSHVVWAGLAIFGLGLIVRELAWVYETIRLFGAAYLLYLGAKILRSLWQKDESGSAPVARVATRNFADSYKKGLIVGLTNPKAAAFFGSLFVTLLPAHAPLWVQGTTLVAVTLVSIAWFSTVALLLSTERVQQGYARIRRPIDAVMGAALIAIGAKLALEK